MKKTAKLYIVFISLLTILCMVSICTGSIHISITDTISNLISVKNNQTAYIVRNMRLPRTIASVLTGACLACCGLIFQSIFKNPMADSYIMGISSASSCSVAIAVALGLNTSMHLQISTFAFIGALICCSLLFLVSRRNPSSLLLTGIAANFFLSALTTLFIYLSGKNADTILFWTMGSLEGISIRQNTAMALVTLITALLTIAENKSLDLMLLDDSTALSSGLDIKKIRIIMIALACLATSVIVSFCGIIGFIGLMSPHLVRSINGPAHKNLIPLSMLAGSNLLLISDIVSRVIIAPAQLPVGIVTSIIGAPVFFMVFREKNK